MSNQPGESPDDGRGPCRPVRRRTRPTTRAVDAVTQWQGAKPTGSYIGPGGRILSPATCHTEALGRYWTAGSNNPIRTAMMATHDNGAIIGEPSFLRMPAFAGALTRDTGRRPYSDGEAVLCSGGRRCSFTPAVESAARRPAAVAESRASDQRSPARVRRWESLRIRPVSRRSRLRRTGNYLHLYLWLTCLDGHQLVCRPKSFTWKGTACLVVNQADQVQLVGHCRELATDGLPSQKESAVGLDTIAASSAFSFFETIALWGSGRP
jgi:hypothetical protein